MRLPLPADLENHVHERRQAMFYKALATLVVIAPFFVASACAASDPSQSTPSEADAQAILEGSQDTTGAHVVATASSRPMIQTISGTMIRTTDGTTTQTTDGTTIGAMDGTTIGTMVGMTIPTMGGTTIRTMDGTMTENGLPPPGRWLNRNVVGMGLTSLLCDAGHEMATAVLAGFLTVIGAPVYSLGIIEGVADAMSSFVKLGAGWWSDRLGHRKAITTAGYALTGGAFVLFAVATVGRWFWWDASWLGSAAASVGRCEMPCWPSR